MWLGHFVLLQVEVSFLNTPHAFRAGRGCVGMSQPWKQQGSRARRAGRDRSPSVRSARNAEQMQVFTEFVSALLPSAA